MNNLDAALECLTSNINYAPDAQRVLQKVSNAFRAFASEQEKPHDMHACPKCNPKPAPDHCPSCGYLMPGGHGPDCRIGEPAPDIKLEAGCRAIVKKWIAWGGITVDVICIHGREVWVRGPSGESRLFFETYLTATKAATPEVGDLVRGIHLGNRMVIVSYSDGIAYGTLGAGNTIAHCRWEREDFAILAKKGKP